MSRFSLITFDCYGTLINWESGMKNALGDLAREKSLDIDIEALPQRYIEIELDIEQSGYRKYKEVLTLGVRRLFQEVGVELSNQEETVFADTINKWPPFEETHAVLKELKKNHGLAILSNIDDDIIRRSIDLMGVEFDAVITAEQVRSYKPSRRHWERALEVTRLPKEKILHIAASYVHDIVPAKEMGFTTVWINRNNEKITGDIRPDYEFASLEPLLKLISIT
ncbi:MAG TPA: haloacid dehalogenase type II [Thermodesulfobacteriota bacterium]|nr:haloacid dehalogenase type II [Thermodesulfobacteriota bacterium]